MAKTLGTDIFGNTYKELDLAEEGVSDVSELPFSNVFGSTASPGNGMVRFTEALSAHGAAAQKAGLSGIEYEAGLKGVSMEQFLGDMWDMTHANSEKSLTGGYTSGRASFIMDAQQYLAEQHGMSLGEYQNGGDALIKSAMGSGYGKETFGYNEPAQAKSVLELNDGQSTMTAAAGLSEWGKATELPSTPDVSHSVDEPSVSAPSKQWSGLEM